VKAPDRSGTTTPTGTPTCPTSRAASRRATGHVVYDAKQRAARAFEPFFSPTPAYEDDEVLEQLGLATLNHYDAIGRLVGQDLTDGTFTRITYASWSIDREDANDTVLESIYRATREGLPASDPRKQALEHAKTHANTASSRYLDPFGREVGTLARGGSTADDRRMEVDYTADGRLAQIIDARGLVAFQYRHDMRGRRMFEHTIDAGDRRALFDALGRPRWMWNDRGFEIVTNTATNETVRIRIDNIYADNSGAFQMVDAKFSGVNDLTTSALENTVTPNQSIAYDWIRTGQPIEVVPAGENAVRAGLPVNAPITIAPSVEMHVNSPNGIVVRTY
jgi:hypothetical protein